MMMVVVIVVRKVVVIMAFGDDHVCVNLELLAGG